MGPVPAQAGGSGPVDGEAGAGAPAQRSAGQLLHLQTCDDRVADTATYRIAPGDRVVATWKGTATRVVPLADD